MSGEKKSGGFLDSFLDVAEAVVDKMEESRDLSGNSEDSREVDKRDKEDSAIDASFKDIPSSSKPALIFGFINGDDGGDCHMFEGYSKISLCGRLFKPEDFSSRKTELEIDKFKGCGTCFRIIISRYLES